jgi:hypothetical protein
MPVEGGLHAHGTEHPRSFEMLSAERCCVDVLLPEPIGVYGDRFSHPRSILKPSRLYYVAGCFSAMAAAASVTLPSTRS